MRHLSFFLFLALFLAPSPSLAKAPQLDLYPVIVTDPEVANLNLDALLKVSLMAARRHVVVPKNAPGDYDANCVRSILCLRRLASASDGERILVGLGERDGNQLRLYLVLFDSQSGSMLKATEKRFPLMEAGAQIPPLVAQLVADEPPMPKGTASAKKQPAPSPDKSPKVINRPRPIDEEDFRAMARKTSAPARFFLTVSGGYAYTARKNLLSNGLTLDVQWGERFGAGLSVAQLNGFEEESDTVFFLPTAAANLIYRLSSEALYPFAGAEVRSILLANDLSMFGGALLGGMQADLTTRWSARASLAAGAVGNQVLPDTVWALSAVQPYVELRLNFMMRLQ